MEKSEQINELVGALSKAQGVIIPASKDSNNPFFKSKYADLASVWQVARDPLYKNGLSVTQHPSADGNVVTIETILTHGSGQWMSSKLTMQAKDASPQAIGSCITYIRRYSLSSIIGIASEEDDDGNAATPKTESKSTYSPSNPAPTSGMTMIEAVRKVAKEKFSSPTEFQAWRIDNGLPEKLEGLSDFELAKIMTHVREYDKYSKIEEFKNANIN